MKDLCGNYEENYKIELEKGTMMKIQGAFSTLLSKLGSNELFKMLIKEKNSVKSQLEIVNLELASNIIDAVNRGIKIISFAEPSALPNIIGEHYYKEFVACYAISLFQSIQECIEPSLIHICPGCSMLLEKNGLIDVFTHKADSRNYIDILKDSNYKFVGHNCINHKNVDQLYEIKLR